MALGLVARMLRRLGTSRAPPPSLLQQLHARGGSNLPSSASAVPARDRDSVREPARDSSGSVCRNDSAITHTLLRVDVVPGRGMSELIFLIPAARYSVHGLPWRSKVVHHHLLQGHTMSSSSWSEGTRTPSSMERTSPSSEVDEHSGGEAETDCDSDKSGSEFEDHEWEDDSDDADKDADYTDEDGDFADVEDTEELDEPRTRAYSSIEHLMRIEAPVDEIYALLHSRGFITNKQKRPTPNDSVLNQPDHRIVAWYRQISVGLLRFYACCDNLLKVKAIVNYHLRWSAIHTLSKKHKSSSHQIIQKYGKNLVVASDGKTLASFLRPEEIKQFQRRFSEADPVPPDLLIDVLFTRMKRQSREERNKT